MTSVLLPDWAVNGVYVPPDATKIALGWTIGEKPPHEYMNWWQRTVVARLNHVLSNGVPEWESTKTYAADSMAKRAGIVYRAITPNTNSQPPSGNWIAVTQNASALTAGTVDKARLPEVQNPTTFQTANPTASTFERIGQAINSLIEFKTTGGSIYAGQGATGIFSIGTDLNQNTSSNRKFSVDAATGNVAWTGSASGNGSGLTNLNAAALAAGNVPNARLTGSYTNFVNIAFSGTLTGSGANLTALNASNLSTGTLPNARLSGDYSFANLELSGGVSGNGSGLTNLNADRLASGTVPNARLSGSYTGFTSLVGTGFSRFQYFTSTALGGIFRGNAGDSAASPSFTWEGDLDTGFYRSSSNVIGVTTGGSLIASFGSTSFRVTGDIYASGVFDGSGANLTDLNASRLTVGTLPNDRLSGGYSFSSLTLSGSANIAGNITVGGVVTGAERYVATTGGSASSPCFGFTGPGGGGIGMHVYGSSDSALHLVYDAASRLAITATEVAVQGGASFSGNGIDLTFLNASELRSGTVSVDRLPTNTSARDWVGERYASLSQTAIGSIVLAGSDPGNAYNFGSTYAGSSLTVGGISRNSSNDADINLEGPTLPGTWRAIGQVRANSRSLCLFKRIA